MNYKYDILVYVDGALAGYLPITSNEALIQSKKIAIVTDSSDYELIVEVYLDLFWRCFAIQISSVEFFDFKIDEIIQIKAIEDFVVFNKKE